MHNHHHHNPTTPSPTTSTSHYIILSSSVISLLLFAIALTLTTQTTYTFGPHPHPSLFPPHPPSPNSDTTPPPSLAYLLSASSDDDSSRILRLLYAVYHPNNHYLIHLDGSARQTDRDELAFKVQSEKVFRAARNVHVLGKGEFVFRNGPSELSATLRGAAVLLRVSGDWDWFVSLRADDYPLVTQDDLLHILSYMPRDLNFVNHTSYIGWRESKKLKPIIIDPSLFLTENSEMFFATQRRPLPDAYRLFSGSSSPILSRKFIEFCITGTDNFPRTLLMYLSNTPTSASIYFPTVLCNSREFNKTAINHGLSFASLDSKKQPRFLNSSDFEEMKQSGAAFASPIASDDPVLDRVDREILLRKEPYKPVRGGWCLGDSERDRCEVWGDASVLKPGPGAKGLERRLVRFLVSEMAQSRQCVDE